MKQKRLVSLIAGPLAFLIVEWILQPFLEVQQVHVVAVSVWMVIWWFLEVVHLGVTALLPLLLWPLMGVQEIKPTAAHYAHPLVYLFFGGFVLALAIQRWNLHRRIALFILWKAGSKPSQILFGFMLSTFLLSMWISNTATTVMMLPIAVSVLDVLPKKMTKAMSLSLLLGIAWSANVGGMATLVGTPPNLVFAGFVSDQLKMDVSFSEWIAFGLPIATILFLGCFALLARMLRGLNKEIRVKSHVIKDQYKALGPMKTNERRVLIIFAATALLWITRTQLIKWFGISGLSDTSIAIASALLLFLLPRKGGKKGLLEWSETQELPWGILLLFGGGLALASGFKSSGLLELMSQLPVSQLSFILLLIAVVFVGIFLTELVSNLALVTTILPILYAVSLAADMEFFSLAIPFTLSASCAFMLPMATPPNAIIFSSGRISIRSMAYAGIGANLIAWGTLVVFALWNWG
ncbi:MAG: DASS family sodium-coupled anion symporter [Schleiferiaceae bacterium]